MKPYIIFTSLFTDNWDDFQSKIYSVIEDNLDFSLNINHIIDVKDIVFLSDCVDVSWTASDGEDNVGNIITSFDEKGLIRVFLYFQYEDGNEYDNVVYER